MIWKTQLLIKNAIKYLNEDVVKKYNVFPFDFKNNYLYVAMQNPDDIFIIDEIKVYAQVEIKPFLADKNLISNAICYFYTSGKERHKASEKTIIEDVKLELGNEVESVQDNGEVYKLEQEQVKVSNQDKPNNIDNSIRNIVVRATKNNATDIHLDIYNNKPRIRYRIEGLLIDEETVHVESFEALISKIKAMAGLANGETDTPQKGCILYDIEESDKLNLDVFTLPTVKGEKLLIKIENDRQPHTVETLGLSQNEKETLKRVVEKKSGAVFVTGLEKSGKTATCYALLREILSNEKNIITIENRVHEKIDGISQIQPGSKDENTINNLLKSVVEHDPDVIMVDTEVTVKALKYLLNVALGGKFIIITMPYKNTYETLNGLLNLGVEPYVIASSVEAIIAQYLVRKLCVKCRNKDSEIIGKVVQKPVSNCNVCNGKGYKGMTGIFEIFALDESNKNLISKCNNNNLELFEKYIDEGDSTLYKSCIRLVTEGVVSVDEIVRLSSDIRRI